MALKKQLDFWKHLQPRTKSWILLVFVSMVWGSSFILIKRGLQVFSPQQVGALRMGITFLALLPFLLLRFKTIPINILPALFTIGVVGSGIPSVLYPLAQTQIGSAAAGVLNSLTPFFVLTIGVLFFGAHFVPRKLLGITVGLIGAAGLILLAQPLQVDGNKWYAVFAVIATLCYGISVNIVKNYCQDISAITINAVAFAFIGPFALVYLLNTNFTQLMHTHPQAWQSLGYVSILALVGTALAAILFFKVTQMTNPLFASMTTYMIPVFALSLGVFDGEPISWVFFAGLSLILVGVYLVNKA